MSCGVNRCMVIPNEMEIVYNSERKGIIMSNSKGNSFKNNNPLIKDYRNNGL